MHNSIEMYLNFEWFYSFLNILSLLEGDLGLLSNAIVNASRIVLFIALVTNLHRFLLASSGQVVQEVTTVGPSWNVLVCFFYEQTEAECKL